MTHLKTQWKKSEILLQQRVYLKTSSSPEESINSKNLTQFKSIFFAHLPIIHTDIALHSLPARQELMTAGLPVNVSDTVQSTTGVSTQRFGELMRRKEIFPFQSSILDILSFLQDLQDKGFSFLMINTYLSAISAFYVGFEGKSLASSGNVLYDRCSAEATCA